MQRTKLLDSLKPLGSTLASLLRPVGKLLRLPKMLPRSLMTAALIATFLVICFCLSACNPKIVRPSLPPQADPRPVPAFNGRTYRDVILYVIELRESCQASEADKAAIRRALLK